MNGLTLIGIAIVVFAAAYLGYGRWLVKTWGIDPQAKVYPKDISPTHMPSPKGNCMACAPYSGIFLLHFP